MEPFDIGNKQSVYFIVKNVSSINRVIKIFNTKIGPGQQLDLMAIPGVSEEDVRASLLKGQLKQLLNNKSIIVINSTISLNSPDSVFTQFLNTNNVYSGFVGNSGALTQIDWYVDWANGDDNNNGATAATAVKTVMGGIVARWGTISPILTQTTTLHIISSQTLNAEAIVLKPILTGGANFLIVGTPTTASSTTLSGVIVKNRATPQLLNANLGSAPTTGTLVQNLTHPSKAFINAQLGGNVAAMTQPIQQGSHWYSPSEVDTWANGDAVNVLSLPLLNLRVFAPSGGDDATIPVIQDVWIPDETGTPGTSRLILDIKTPRVQLLECLIDPQISCHGAGSIFSNCYITSTCWCFSGDTCLFLGGEIINTLFSNGGSIVVDCDVILGGVQNFSLNNEIGYAYINNGGFYEQNGGWSYINKFLLGGAALWGPGKVYALNGGSIFFQSTTAAASMLWTGGTVFDDSATSGCSVSSVGVFTGGVAISATNVDTSPNNIVYTRTWSRIGYN